jgi:L-fuculokinase
LANAFPRHEVFAASLAQASALGAALAIHHSWNENPPARDYIEVKYYPATRSLGL